MDVGLAIFLGVWATMILLDDIINVQDKQWRKEHQPMLAITELVVIGGLSYCIYVVLNFYYGG